jgi:hypothetical protein
MTMPGRAGSPPALADTSSIVWPTGGTYHRVTSPVSTPSRPHRDISRACAGTRLAMRPGMQNLNGKLSPHFVWLFALGTLGVVLLVTKLMPGPVSPKTMAAIYFALFGAGATAATFVTRTSVLASIAAFGAAGLGLGGWYYAMIAGMAPGSSFGSGLGLVFAVAFSVDALAAGIAGTLFGLKIRKNLVPAILAS